jgi:hypothetical protein
MQLKIDTDHDIGSLRLYEPGEQLRTVESIPVEHRLGDELGEIRLRFDGEGHLFSIEFMRPSKQLLPSQLGLR